MGSVAVALVCALPASAASDFKDVAIRCAASAKDPKLTSYRAEAILDDAGSALTVRMDSPDHKNVTIPTGDILKVVVDVAIAAQIAPGGAEPQKRYWFYFERKPGAYPERFSLELGQQGGDLLAKARPLFGGRLQELDFPLAQELGSLASLTDLNVNYFVRVLRTGPPIPAVPKDRVLVVVVCPAVEGARKQPINLDANGRVVAVNEPGTYSFVNLDPGEYMIASQAENARWFQVKLEAGKVYYFFQDVLEGGDRTSVSMHSKEMALFEMAAASYSDWRRVKY
jgi:hypothetical protein